MCKIAVFPGTFNPFTIGHEYIVNEALKAFDKVIILFALNNEKEVNNAAYNKLQVQRLYEGNPNVIIDSHSGLTYKYCLEHNACLIRGIRNTVDFEYERSIDAFNQQFGVSTFYVISPANLSFVSSSFVRSLYDKDVIWKQYIPKKLVI